MRDRGVSGWGELSYDEATGGTIWKPDVAPLPSVTDFVGNRVALIECEAPGCRMRFHEVEGRGLYRLLCLDHAEAARRTTGAS